MTLLVTSFTDAILDFFYSKKQCECLQVGKEGRELCETLRRLSGFSDCISVSRGACQFAKLITKPWSFKLDSPLT